MSLASRWCLPALSHARSSSGKTSTTRAPRDMKGHEMGRSPSIQRSRRMNMRLTSVGQLCLLGIVACGYATTVLAQVDVAPQQTLAASSSPVHGAMPANRQGVQDNGGRRTVIASRLAADESIALDGGLDEPFWSRAVPATDFIQIDPANGMAATEPTEVRIMF